MFPDISEDDRAMLTNWLAYIAALMISYTVLQKKLADVMHRMVRRTWPMLKKNYSLYSTRHEFAALAKLYYEMNDESTSSLAVAALMGHASDVTASTHYARFNGKKLPPDLIVAVARLPLASSIEMTTVRSRLMEKKKFLKTRKAHFDAGEQTLV